MSTERWTAFTVAMAAFIIVVVIGLAQITPDGPPTAAATASPAPTVLGATATPLPAAAVGTLTPSPAPTPTPLPPRTADEAARQLAAALEASDWQRIRALISPTGWIAAYYESDGVPREDRSGPRMMRNEAIRLLRERTPDGRMRADVFESPILVCRDYHPCIDHDRYVRSIWMAFEGSEQQNVHLVLKRESDGTWYWSAALFRAPD